MKRKHVIGICLVAGLCAAGLVIRNPTLDSRQNREIPAIFATAPLQLDQLASSDQDACMKPKGKNSSRKSDGNLSAAPANVAGPDGHDEAQPQWAVAFGKEFWRRRSHSEPVRDTWRGNASPDSVLNLGEVMERVSHAFRTEGGESKPHVQARTYRAELDGAGLRFTPGGAVPESSWPVDARVRTIRIASGEKDIYGETSCAGEASRSIVGNTAQRLLVPELGIVEHLEAQTEGVALTWIVRKPLTDSGALSIDVELTGLV
jgi:hypothetical protein